MGKIKDQRYGRNKKKDGNRKSKAETFFDDYSKEIGNSKLLLRVIPNEEGTIPNEEGTIPNIE